MNRTPIRFFVLILVPVAAVFGADTQVPASVSCVSFTDGSPYNQNFNSLASTGGTSSTLPAGWAFGESGTTGAAIDGLYRVGTGSDTTGDVYSFGASGDTERALGTLFSGSNSPRIGACFTNNTGTVIQVSAGFTGEQWRVGQVTAGRAADRLDFQYSTNATSLFSGTWTDLNSLDFISPVTTGSTGAINGNTSNAPVSPVPLGISLASGATLWIRWVDADLAPGSDDGLAIDDFSLTQSTTPTLPSASGLATPAALPPGGSTTLSATVTAGANPTSTGFAVTCDLTAIGGASTFSLPSPGFSAPYSVPLNIAPAGYSLPCTVTDDQSRMAPFSIGLSVTAPFTCGSAKTFIHAIQGSGSTSQMTGALVDIEGIVTGSYQSTTTGLSGFYIQEADADWDADVNTSEGIFVFDSGFGVAVHAGDRVRVRGKVAEFGTTASSLTELSGISGVQACGIGNSFTRTMVSLPVANLTDWEKYEGMAVTFPQPLVVTGNFDLGQFGQVDLAPSLLVQPTQVVAPGAAATARQSLNDRSVIQLDDASEVQDPFPSTFPVGGLSAIAPVHTLRTGDTVAYVNASNQPALLEAVVDERHGAYRILALDPSKLSFTSTNPRPATVGPVGGRFTVASANLDNFFFGPPFPTSRGASDQAELDRQWPKTVAALCGLNADVLAINELGNNPDANPNSGLNFLLLKLNASCGPYTAINTNQVGTDQIRSTILYKAARVTPVGSFAVLGSNPGATTVFNSELNRPSVAQTFKPATGPKPEKQYFTVVTNHYKARTSSTSCDADTGDGQDSCNTMRLNMASNVLRWLYGDGTAAYPGNPTGDPTPAANRRYLLVGDFNAYAMEDPFRALSDPGFSKAATAKYPAGWPANPKANFINLMQKIIGPGAYSYNFGSQNGYLDHALANPVLERQITGVTEWHINTDEPTVFDYTTDFKTAGPGGSQTVYYASDQYRNSDHDPFLVGLNPLPGDLDDDGDVDVNDGNLLRLQIGKSAAAPGVDRRMDFDNDGVISLNDYRLWSTFYLQYQQ